nr:MAG TPA: hypothetical protein [Caudoviricetes sp.]
MMHGRIHIFSDRIYSRLMTSYKIKILTSLQTRTKPHG